MCGAPLPPLSLCPSSLLLSAPLLSCPCPCASLLLRGALANLLPFFSCPSAPEASGAAERPGSSTEGGGGPTGDESVCAGSLDHLCCATMGRPGILSEGPVGPTRQSAASVSSNSAPRLHGTQRLTKRKGSPALPQLVLFWPENLAPVASPAGLRAWYVVLLLAFLCQLGAAHAGACGRVRHPSWPDNHAGKTGCGVSTGSQQPASLMASFAKPHLWRITVSPPAAPPAGPRPLAPLAAFCTSPAHLPVLRASE